MSKVFKAVGNAISGVVNAVVGVVSSVVKAVVDIASSVINFVVQPFMGMLGGGGDIPDAGAEAQRQQGVLVQRQGSNVNIPVVYGYRKVGGVVTFAETGSSNNKYMYVAYVFSEGLVEGLREVYIDDWLLPVDQTASLNAGQRITVNADRYKDRVQMQWWPGQYYTTPSQSPVGTDVKNGIFAEAPSFAKDMIYNGLAVLFCRYEWKDIVTQADSDSNPFSGNIPNVQVALLGKRVASLLVNAESTEYDVAPIRYSTNPAEILLDYMRNPRYGKGIVNNDIHWDTWKAAARKCNQTVTYVNAANISGPILTSNYVLDTGTTIFANVKTLLMGFRAYMPYVQGKYKLRIEDAGNELDILSGAATIVATFTKDNIVGSISYTGIEKSAKYNVVSVSYVDPDQKFSVQTAIHPETNAERQYFIDLDGGRENKLETTFPTLTNYAIAKDMARLLFKKSRRQETCSLTVSSQGLELEPGDCIRINATILNFGTDPWRIVSFKVNDDMTVSLGCVRNPDDIYPYVRAGEQDIVLPTYVPKGSIIYFPSSSNTVLLGLVPPLYAIYPTNYIPVNYNPGATNPNGPGGGGVGGGSPTGGTAGPIGSVTPTPVPPTNVVPTPVPTPIQFSGALTVTNTTITDWKNGTYSINVNFKQPTDGLYKFAKLWWRANVYSPWVEVSLTNLPGAGGSIPWTLGALPRGVFEFYVRAFAADGRASTQILSGFLATRADYLELNPAFSGLVTAGVSTVTEGWTLPTGSTSVSSGPRYDADIDRFEIRPRLVGGFPTATRYLDITIQQLENILAKPLNLLVNGFTVYWREPGETTYWAYETFKFPSSYSPGQTLTYSIQSPFGTATYPGSIVQGATADILQQYEFFVRLTYSDGNPATRQLQVARGKVEQQGGLYNFVVFGTTAFSGNEDITTAFNLALKTIDQRPAGFVAGANIVPSINNIAADPNASKITFKFNPVISTKFRGFKIRYREVISGANPAFVELQTVTSPQGDVLFYILDTNYSHGKQYDWVITAQYTEAGAQNDATNSFVSRTRIDFNDPERDSLATRFNFTTKNTVEALAALKAAFPALPVANIKSWNKVIANSTFEEIELEGTNQPGYFPKFYINKWYRIRFQLPSTALGLYVYRRMYDTYAATKTTTSNSTAKYWGIGPWERARLPVVSLVADSEGWYTANIRGPVHYGYFNPYYEVSGFGAQGLLQTNYSLGWPSVNAVPKLSGMRPYAGIGNNVQTSTSYMQYLFVIQKANGLPETKGLLLRDFYTDDQGGNYKPEKEGFGLGGVRSDVVIEDLDAAFNTTFEAGYGRRLSESLISSPAGVFTLTAVDNLDPRPIPQLNKAFNGTYTQFLQNPRIGTANLY